MVKLSAVMTSTRTSLPIRELNLDVYIGGEVNGNFKQWVKLTKMD
jgi:hypothetical protein